MRVVSVLGQPVNPWTGCFLPAARSGGFRESRKLCCLFDLRSHLREAPEIMLYKAITLGIPLYVLGLLAVSAKLLLRNITPCHREERFSRRSDLI